MLSILATRMRPSVTARESALPTPSPNIVEASTQRLIDQLFQAQPLAPAQALEAGGYVIIDGQCRSHHQNIINLMS